MPELSLIIPTYNRSEILIQNVLALRQKYPEAEIIIIDDGSTDQTKGKVPAVLGKQVIFQSNISNKGKGFSLRRGALLAHGQYVIFTDDDLPYGLEGIALVYQELKKGKPVVIGERAYFVDSLPKKIARPVFNWFFKPFLGIQMKDTQAGLKGFSHEAAQNIFRRSIVNSFALDLEIIVLCQKLNYPITKVPVVQKDTTPSHLSFRQMFQIFLDVFKIKFHRYE
ncbi:MAG: dolichyl-phosphate beta-glucosyltransferase [Patescibacteria group bacterium]|nr:dolichyl-phosphate beta-glucosyltransferase [Patescibacteria group bacterium]